MAPPTSARIADHYRRLIKSGELKAGDWLPKQSDIMEEWDVSVTPVRAAMKILESEGLIESLQGVGARVVADERVLSEDYRAALAAIHRLRDAGRLDDLKELRALTGELLSMRSESRPSSTS